MYVICYYYTKVTDRGGPLGCETSRLSHFLDNRSIDGGEVVIIRTESNFKTLRHVMNHYFVPFVELG
jgi:hypothetical protein